MKYNLLIILAILVLLVGCAPGQPGSTTDAGNTNDNPDNSKTGTNIVEQGANLMLLNEINGKMKTGPSGQYKVTYDMDFGQGTKNTYTMYFKSQNKYRVDTSAEGMISQGYFVDGTSTMCTKQDDKFTCLTVKPEEVSTPVSTSEIGVTEHTED